MNPTPLDIKARAFGINMEVKSALDPTKVRLTNTEVGLDITVKREIFPFLVDKDMVTVFVNIVRVGFPPPEPTSGIIIPESIAKPN